MRYPDVPPQWSVNFEMKPGSRIERDIVNLPRPETITFQM